jgi:hypothetical protein
MLLASLVIILLLGGAYLYVFKIGAIVTIDIAPKSTDEQEQIVFATTGGSNFSKDIIAAEVVSTSLSGSASTDATGKKEVGNKAKGTLTLFNSDDSKKTLPEGTVITSGNNLDFVLDKEISIASASGDIFSGIKSGTAQAAVTAKEIGTEFNLPSNTKFTVGKQSTLAAKNDNAFSGGSKKTVTVVSKKDTDRLVADLPKGLEAKAREDLQKKIGTDVVLIPVFTDRKLEKPTFDKKVDEEAKSVKLTANVTFQTVSYKKDELTQYAQVKLKNKFSQDVTIPEKSIKTELKNIKVTDDEDITADASINAGILPKLDREQLIRDITGKSFAEAEVILRDVPQVKSASLKLSPNIPFLPKMLPRVSENINLVINTNE